MIADAVFCFPIVTNKDIFPSITDRQRDAGPSCAPRAHYSGWRGSLRSACPHMLLSRCAPLCQPVCVCACVLGVTSTVKCLVQLPESKSYFALLVSPVTAGIVSVLTPSVPGLCWTLSKYLLSE